MAWKNERQGLLRLWELRYREGNLSHATGERLWALLRQNVKIAHASRAPGGHRSSEGSGNGSFSLRQGLVELLGTYGGLERMAQEPRLIRAALNQLQGESSNSLLPLFREKLRNRLRLDPEHGGLWTLWFSIGKRLEFPHGLLQSFPRPPGLPWPPFALLERFYYHARNQGFQALALPELQGWSAREGHPQVLGPERWRAHQHQRARALAYAAIALKDLGRYQEAQSTLETSRGWAGAEWERLRETLLKVFPSKEWPFVLKGEAAPENQIREDLPSEPPPLRLIGFGPKEMRTQWEALLRAPPLDLWLPFEWALEWLEGWERSDLHWALMHRDAILLSGKGYPEPLVISEVLREHKQPILEPLDRFLHNHPLHLAARRFRFDLIKSQVSPSRRLQHHLLQDVRLARLQPDFDLLPPQTWQQVAASRLPEIRAALHLWPLDPQLWKDYEIWSKCGPWELSLRSFLEELELPGPIETFLPLLPEGLQAQAQQERSSNLD